MNHHYIKPIVVKISPGGLFAGKSHAYIELAGGPIRTGLAGDGPTDLARAAKRALKAAGVSTHVILNTAPILGPQGLGELVDALSKQGLTTLVQIRPDVYETGWLVPLSTHRVRVELAMDGMRQAHPALVDIASCARYICRSKHNCIRDGLPALAGDGVSPLRPPRPGALGLGPSDVFIQPEPTQCPNSAAANLAAATMACTRFGYTLAPNRFI